MVLFIKKSLVSTMRWGRCLAFLATLLLQLQGATAFHRISIVRGVSSHHNKVIGKSHSSLHRFHMSAESVDDEDEFDNSYRVESVKSGVFGALGGSIGSLPVAVLIGYFQHFNAQWELSHDALALSLFLFGITYRYAVRGDVNNKQLQLGVVGAFAVVRALNMVDVSDYCTSLPLNCGPPFFYFDIPMISIGLVNFFESLVAFGTAAQALEFAFKAKILTRC